jgi:hypothetical protein
MKTNKIALSLVLFLFLSTWAAFAFAPATEGSDPGYVRVAVRFAKVRLQPDIAARPVREIGFGTLLKKLEAGGDFVRVAPLGSATTSETWYVLRADVEPAPEAAAQALVETRRVAFLPDAPAPGQQVLFTASGFRTPNLLKWDLGDGTVLITGGKAPAGGEATLAHVFAAPGTYAVRVYDKGGADSLPPVLAKVIVSAYSRSLRVSPELPVANQPVIVTALNFAVPERIAWDFGDGAELSPGPGPGVLKPTFQVRHEYAKEGRYLVKAYDGGDRGRPPLTIEVRVAADPRRVLLQPGRAEAGSILEFSAAGFNTPDRLRWDMGDGTVLGSGGSGDVIGSLLHYSYGRPGEYEVRVYDWNGDTARPPVRFSLTVHPASAPRQATVNPAAVARVETPAPAAAPTPPPRARSKYPLIKLGPYAGYFRPTDALFKDIYGEGDALYGARLGLRIWKGFYLWLSFSQFKSIGRTTFTEDKTTITLQPANAGLRFELGQGSLIPYVGVGYTYLSFKEESENVGGTKSNQAGNVSGEAGFEFKLNRHLYIDLGARFDQIFFTPENSSEKLDLGGLQAGVSLLISF